ncbi:MAG: YggS family pyridoxal phosphate-dependent enzyme [Solobacterium sp.]|nr:YggS family pyridoxal phosphate-dependent enzyme [Solobacterium sp.]MBQ1445909.1 YggS family pyridoxal phosphate-dependent enzyme [Solobacterium sp.]MBR0478696.1 YggS family pyridoxal phosphate-dependent enzyme [Solobacterium sp.]
MNTIPVDHYNEVKTTIGPDVSLLVVSKTRSEEEIMAYYALGQRCFGENHAQEILAKKDLPADIEWHFIGHLQRNKVRSIAPYVSMVESLDNLPLAKVIEKECARIGKVMPCLAEFHLAVQDENKTGLAEEDAFAFIDEIMKLPHIHLEGIMAMGPHTEDEEEIRRIFLQGKELFDRIREKYGDQIRILSMGMSDDYRIAVECGSTQVRIGSYLFY